MGRVKGLFNQRKIVVLLLASLIVSVVLNGYLFASSLGPLQMEQDEEETYAWIPGSVSQMWTFSIKLTPNKAVFHSNDREFNVSVEASYWEPFGYGNRTFYFKISDKKMDPVEKSPKVVKEKTFRVYKSKEDYDWVIPIFNFTVTLQSMERGIHLFSVIGGTWMDDTPTQGCDATFAIKLV